MCPEGKRALCHSRVNVSRGQKGTVPFKGPCVQWGLCLKGHRALCHSRANVSKGPKGTVPFKGQCVQSTKGYCAILGSMCLKSQRALRVAVTDMCARMRMVLQRECAAARVGVTDTSRHCHQRTLPLLLCTSPRGSVPSLPKGCIEGTVRHRPAGLQKWGRASKRGWGCQKGPGLHAI